MREEGAVTTSTVVTCLGAFFEQLLALGKFVGVFGSLRLVNRTWIHGCLMVARVNVGTLRSVTVDGVGTAVDTGSSGTNTCVIGMTRRVTPSESAYCCNWWSLVAQERGCCVQRDWVQECCTVPEVPVFDCWSKLEVTMVLTLGFEELG
jgi:hypothetical protein